MALLAVITTTATLEEAQRLAQVLVERRLAACAQISPIESYYLWKGQVEHAREYRLLLKTTEARYPEVEQVIRELHSYELPAIFALPVAQAFSEYVRWVEEST
uniref:CutA1 divalent ion tolerance protein n=1 Tax=uncultured Chloroflexota bacterium TaxID=166587 RepID=H5SAK9_9CHLR|nr:CutA1 divalent ion tolerance protein [uncultured Chloroflexota bacterium]